MTNRANLLQEGDIIYLTKDHSVYVDRTVPSYGGKTVKIHDMVRLSDFKWTYLQGQYLVVKTAFDGGGTGHGPHDIYPNGHHVFCESLEGSHKVDFYQTGCFTAMNTDIRPVARATREWKLPKGIR